MSPATAAAEYQSRIGQDYSLLDAFDEQFTDYAPEDVDDEAEHQRMNLWAFEFFYS